MRNKFTTKEKAQRGGGISPGFHDQMWASVRSVSYFLRRLKMGASRGFMPKLPTAKNRLDLLMALQKCSNSRKLNWVNSSKDVWNPNAHAIEPDLHVCPHVCLHVCHASGCTVSAGLSRLAAKILELHMPVTGPDHMVKRVELQEIFGLASEIRKCA